MKTFTKFLVLAAIITLNLQLEISNCSAQYVTIPDAAFVTWLKNNGYASCMSGNMLDTNCNAVLKATTANLEGLPMTNLTGIQYFKNLDSLYDEGGSLTYIPAFPPKLTYIDVFHNPLTTFPALPSTLLVFECDQDSLTSLPALPPKLEWLICESNKITQLPALPSTLTSLECDFNQITSLPSQLPPGLTYFSCGGNKLTSLPSQLPQTLVVLFCGNNYLTNLPPLPASLQLFACQSNFLSSIPALPFDIGLLDVANNPLITCLPHIEQINSNMAGNFDISGTGIRCLDGIITHPQEPSIPAIDTMPLCSGAYNPNGCPAYIPDSNFVKWLDNNGYASCMSGPYLDVNCPAVLYADSINCSNSNIADLTGIQYFVNVTYLNCSQNVITTIALLPPALATLVCSSQEYSGYGTGYLQGGIDSLPSTLQYLDCNSNGLQTLPSLPASLWYIDCSGNALSCLPTLPANLYYINTAGTFVQCVPNNPNNASNLPVCSNVNSAAAISATATSICTGTSVTFRYTANVRNVSSYQWKKNNVVVGGDSAQYVSGTLVNGDVINCTVTGNVCSTPSTNTSNSITMAVGNPTDTASVTISTPITTICEGSYVTFIATAVNGGANPTYSWRFNGTVQSGATYSTISTGYLPTGNVVCVMTSSLACAVNSPATSNTIAMTVTPPAFAEVTISANPSGAICQGTSVTFTATPTNGGATPSYQWKLNGNDVGANSDTYTSSALNSGDIVECEMTSSLSCVTNSPATSNAITMTISSSLPASVSIAANPSGAICQGTSVTFTATPTNGGSPTYQWKLNGNDDGTNSDTYTSSTLVNGDVVICVMTSSLSCASGSPAASNAITVVVDSSVAASVTITVSPGDTICQLTPVTFTATPTNGGNPTYQWKIDGRDTSNNNLSTFSISAFHNGDKFSCVMTSSAACVTNSHATSDTITMTVNPQVNASVSISATPGDTICQGSSATFVATETNGGTPSYLWEVKSTIVGTNSDTYTSSSLANGDVVSCIMTSNLACVRNSNPVSNYIFMTVNNCIPANSIAVHIYQDNNSNCTQDGSEPSVNNVKVNIYKGALLVQQGYVFGTDTFTIDTGTYTLVVDTAALPYGFTCPTGGDTTITVSSSNPTPTINFGLQCKPGFDIGVWSIVKSSFLFPGDTASVAITAGDINKVAFGTACNTNAVSGTLVVLISGPADYDGVANGASTPAYTSNDSLVYNVADFSAPGNFAFKMVTAPGAALGQQVCIDAHVTLNSPGDRDTMNNSLSQCFVVNNSFDPNYKEVGPPGSIQTPYTGWLTYTVHFQNTGNAAAQKIVVRDTLDANLAPGTFQLLNYSAQPQVQISGHYVTFTFAGINLPDSITSPDGSMGYVEYRIQPISNLSGGQSVSNTASIYFDFNNPVRTNTITSSFNLATGVNKLEVGGFKLEVYPNPANDVVNIVLFQPCENCIMTLTDVTGRAIMQTPLNGMNTSLNLSSVSAGVYFVRVSNENGTMTKKIVKQ